MSAKRFITLGVCLTLLLVSMWGFELPPVARAATITVTTTSDGLNDGDGCSLREAIQAANSNSAVDACPTGSGDDTITLPAGTYTLSIGSPGEDSNAGGDLDITSNVTINGAGAISTTIDGSQIDRVLHIHSGATVVINGVTITNGKTPDGAAGANGGDGGGIYNDGVLTLNNCIVSNNATGQGGDGSSSIGGDGGLGGGIFNASPADTLTLNHSTVSGNVTGRGGNGAGTTGAGYGYNGGQGGHGGGIYVSEGSLTLSGSTVSGNTAGSGGNGSNASTMEGGRGGDGGSGGGIYNHLGTITLDDSTISDNTAGNGGNGGAGAGGHFGGYAGSGGDGGGMFTYGDTLTNCTISGNTSGNGGNGGDYRDGGRGGNGGGMYNSLALPLTACTISDNTTGGGGAKGAGGASDGPDGNGGGMYNSGSPQAGNTIVANNAVAGTGSGPDCSGTMNPPAFKPGYNLVENTSGCTVNGTYNITGQDPQLDALADNGGPTETHALQTGSPAIDVITSTQSCTAGDKDQRYALRANGTNQGGSACDIGAYEVSNTFEQDVTGTGMYYLHKTKIEVTSLGTLSKLTVLYVASDHPNATRMNGQYWTITATGIVGSFNLTLPHSGLTYSHTLAQVCRYTGGPGSGWDCDRTSSTSTTVTRNGLSTFSDWAVGDNVGPTVTTLHNLAARSPDWAYVGVIALILLIPCSVVALRRQKRHR